MICPKCSKEIDDAFRFCPHCGRETSPKKKIQHRTKGTGSVYKAANGTWVAQVDAGYANGRRRYRRKYGIPTKKEAVMALEQLRSGSYLADRSKKVSAIWEAMSQKWLDSVSANKEAAYRRAYERLQPLHGADITNLIAQDWQMYVDQIPGAYYPKRDAKIVASKIYQYAIAQGWLQANMAEHIELPSLAAPKKDAFSTSELQLLWNDWRSGYTWTAYILIMCYTGMRPGEIMKIRIQDIHLDERYMVGGIKSKAGIDRCIAFPTFLVPVVRWAIEHQKNGKLLAINEENFYKAYDAALDHAGIIRTKDHPMTPHCCRHTFVTMGTNSGIQLAVLQKMAGHADVKVTAGYNHTHDPELIAAAEKLWAPADS